MLTFLFFVVVAVRTQCYNKAGIRRDVHDPDDRHRIRWHNGREETDYWHDRPPDLVR